MIAVEDSSTAHHPYAADARRVMKLVHDLGFVRVVSAGTAADFSRAGGRMETRKNLIRRHYQVMEPAAESARARATFPLKMSPNDSADLEVLSAYSTGYATRLVTEDRQMRRRAREAGLSGVMSTREALEWLEELVEPARLNSPEVQTPPAYSVNIDAPIFDSLKSDYPGFVSWWRKVVVEQRPILLIGAIENPQAICVLKVETSIGGHDTLKVCTFKVDAAAGGQRRGELLLSSVIQFARRKRLVSTYMTAFERHRRLIDFLCEFGFERVGGPTASGEYIYEKALEPTGEPLRPLAHARKYGPGSLVIESGHVVPIRAQFHSRLMPDCEVQPSLLSHEPCGNAIRKIYICRSNTGRVSTGDTLLMLRTGDKEESRVTGLGVVEDVLRSEDPLELAEFGRGRTVYSLKELTSICADGPALAIKFRFDRCLDRPWPCELLRREGVITRAPQSIASIPEGGLEWVRRSLAVS